MFEQLWKRLRGEGEDDSANATDARQDERRAHPRHPANLDTTCQLVSGSADPIKMRVRDVSRGGMKFLIANDLEPGTLVKINLPASAGHAVVLACIMHSTAESDGTFSVGCAFSDELGDAELRQFGGRKEPAEESDKRAYTRFPAHGNAEYILLPAGGARRQAEITNISATGIGLLLNEKIDPGAILDLVLKTKSNGPSFDILACIVYLGEHPDGRWIAGCSFIRELEDRDLTRLV